MPDNDPLNTAASPKKIAANRRNAKRSTGPKTPDGKAVSRMNALRHGILARSVVVQGEQIFESTREFQKLSRELYHSLAPDGPLEEILVDQIIAVTWRLRRVRTAESGEIALSVDDACWRRESANPRGHLRKIEDTPFPDPLFTRLLRSSWGCDTLLSFLRELRVKVEKDGLSYEVLDYARKPFGKESYPLVSGLNFLYTRPGSRDDMRENALNQIDEEIREVEIQMAVCQHHEITTEKERQMAATLPSAATLEKIHRYETALCRQLYRAMIHLEHMQRRRCAENVPASLTLDLQKKI